MYQVKLSAAILDSTWVIIPRNLCKSNGRHLGIHINHCRKTCLHLGYFIKSQPNPHVPTDRSGKNARIPHLLRTQRAANNGPDPYQSPTYPGGEGGGVVEVYLDWCIIASSWLNRVCISKVADFLWESADIGWKRKCKGFPQEEVKTIKETLHNNEISVSAGDCKVGFDCTLSPFLFGRKGQSSRGSSCFGNLCIFVYFCLQFCFL